MRRRTVQCEKNMDRPHRVGRSRRHSHARNRSNSISALGCTREACIAATVHLCQLYRLPVDEPNLPILDNLPVRSPYDCAVDRSSSFYHPALLDLPAKSVKILGADRWDFDIFALKRHSSNQIVCSMGLHLFDVHQLFQTLHLDRMTVLNALAAIESVYWSHNPYHTALHAADVAQAIHCFISQPLLHRLLSPAERFGSIFAALCHDADHPGMNQYYLQRTDHFLVNLYNASSVLEQHHARVGLCILHQSGISRLLSRSDWETVKNCVIKMVHATDMTHQEFYRAQFTKLVDRQQNEPTESFSQADGLLLLQMSIKCADISNPCRPWPICHQWAYRVCSEFFSQGDQERLRWSLTPTVGCDRNGSSVQAIQIAFITKLLRPLFTKWHEFFQTPLTEQVLTTLDENYKIWQHRLAVPSKLDHSTQARIHPAPTITDSRAQKGAFGSVGKSKLSGLKTVNETKTSKNQSFNVTFDLDDLTQSGQTKCSKDMELPPRGGLHTFFITTRGLRRHSLPETQGAIKKTFNLALSKKPNTSTTPNTGIIAANAISTVSSTSRNVCTSKSVSITAATGGMPSLSPPNVHYVYVNNPCIQSMRTPSGNILQTLCEEICCQESGSKPRAFELSPFPLPDAWTHGSAPVTAPTSCVTTSSIESPAPCVTSLAINLSVSDFIALAHRRSSVPLIDK